MKIGGKDWFSYVIGISPEYRRTAPWVMAQGNAMPGPGEAVIPEVISQLTGIQIGDEITMIDRPLRIVGLSKETFAMSSSIVFVSREALDDLLEASDQFSYIMVYAEPGVNAQALAEHIKQETDRLCRYFAKNYSASMPIIHSLTRQLIPFAPTVLRPQRLRPLKPLLYFSASDRQLVVQMGAEIVRMMTMIGTLLATLIVAFTAYSLSARCVTENSNSTRGYEIPSVACAWMSGRRRLPLNMAIRSSCFARSAV